MDQATARGHLGHLSGEQENKLKALWRKLASATENHSEEAEVDRFSVNTILRSPLAKDVSDFSPEALRKSLWTAVKLEHPDSLLLRYLRSRKWDVDVAFKMIASALRWRTEMHLEQIMAEGEAKELADSLQDADLALKREGEGFMDQLRKGKSFTHKTDLDGRQLIYLRSQQHGFEIQTTHALERFTAFDLETARLLLEPPVQSGTLLVDFTGLGLRGVDFDQVRFLTEWIGSHYPECLHSVIIYNAPLTIGNTRAIIESLFWPIVNASVHFVDGVAALEEFIDRKCIIKELGGDDDYEWDYIEPVPGENDLMQDVATRNRIESERQNLYHDFESITKQWVEGEGTSEEQVEITKQREDIAKRIRLNYCRLDRYIRARCIYDRLGMIDLDAIAKAEMNLPGEIIAKA